MNKLLFPDEPSAGIIEANKQMLLFSGIIQIGFGRRPDGIAKLDPFTVMS